MSKCITIFIFLAVFSLGGCRTGKISTDPQIITIGVNDELGFDNHQGILKIMTLNLAHGKGRSISQEFVSNSKTRENLDELVEILISEGVHIAAFQEADIKSRRSGNFNHVRYIAKHAEYRYVLHGEHMKRSGFYHGTALISKYELTNPASFIFEPVFPLPDKGFVIGTVDFDGLKIDLVSVHLDFARESVRERQARQIVDVLSDRKNPLVLMGDFNCQPQNSKVFDILNMGLGLSAYDLESKQLYTYPFLNLRMDWILISPELEFYSYGVLEDKVSDHLAVIAELKTVKNIDLKVNR
ncbi:MAG: endonuclease/exonuclease/phosphatase family protein [Planctomycetota bacterium]|jgi:endonuclease/exonuclease/phosphatase family metal-dependent hydrolase